MLLLRIDLDEKDELIRTTVAGNGKSMEEDSKTENLGLLNMKH